MKTVHNSKICTEMNKSSIFHGSLLLNVAADADCEAQKPEQAHHLTLGRPGVSIHKENYRS